MKNLLVLFSLFLLLSSCGSDIEEGNKKIVEGTFHFNDVIFTSGNVVETYSGELITGKIYNENFELEVKEGKYHGNLISFDDGVISQIVPYLNGELNGVVKLYSSGKLSKEMTYIDGKLDGKSKSWNQGFLVSESNYLNGKLNGPSFKWDPETFQLLEIENYKDNGLNGLQIKISKYGDTLGQVNLVNGNGKFRYKDNDVKEKEYLFVYKDGKLNGAIKETVQGRTVKEKTYKNGIQEGLEITYNSSGKEVSRKSYAKGLANGITTEYDSNGKKTREGNFVNGFKNGVWNEFNEGKIQDKIKYKNGKLDGNHKSWGYNGNLTLDENYVNGLLSGIYKEWSYDNNLVKEKNYVNGLLSGIYKEWGYDNHLVKEMYFKGGQLNGTAKEWAYDGKLISEKVYNVGKLTKQTSGLPIEK